MVQDDPRTQKAVKTNKTKCAHMSDRRLQSALIEFLKLADQRGSSAGQKLSDLSDIAKRIEVSRDHALKDGRYALIVGQVAREVTSVKGDLQIALLHEPGDSFVQQAAGRLRAEHYRTLTDCELLRFDPKGWMRLLADHPGLAMEALNKAEIQLNRSADRIASLMGDTVGTRLAEYLLRIADHRKSVAKPIRQYDIARYFGVQPETVNRTLRGFINRGLLSRDGDLFVLHDIDRLGRIAASLD